MTSEAFRIAENTTGVNTGDQDLSGLAPKASPIFTGVPAAPTAATGTNTTQLATTAFVIANAVAGGGAPLASPAFTGVPTAPTAAANTSTTQLATTAFALQQDAILAPKASPTFTGAPSAPTPVLADSSTTLATTAYVKGQLYATLLSPALTGVPTAPTAVNGTNTAQIATTAFVLANAAGSISLNSPAFTGTPTAPTAVNTDSSTQLATTAFVKNQGYATTGAGGNVTGPLTSTARTLAMFSDTSGRVLSNGNVNTTGPVGHGANLGKRDVGKTAISSASNGVFTVDESSVTLAVGAPYGNIAIAGASQTSDQSTAIDGTGTPGGHLERGCYGIVGISNNNNTTVVQSAWSSALTVLRQAGAGNSLGCELNINNYGDYAVAYPNSISGTVANKLVCGILMSSDNSIASYGIGFTGAGGFEKGIVFGNSSVASAVAVALPVGYSVGWYNSSNTNVASIRNDANSAGMRIVFGEGTTNFQNLSGNNLVVIGTNSIGSGISLAVGSGLAWLANDGPVGSYIRSDVSASTTAMHIVFRNYSVAFQDSYGNDRIVIDSGGHVYSNGTQVI